MGTELSRSSETEHVIANRYVVEGVLGRGGMATVYKVRDTQSGVRVALKRGLISDPGKTAKLRALLQREYHTLEQLRHPRIIEVYDYGVDELGPYYTMELLDGADLDGGGRLPWREVCALLRDVASSLAILHSRALLHRDVSPRNVRRTEDGRAKLIDFGAMTSIGVSVDVAGTPPFVAPEALQIQPLDARTDLFSLGALAYFLLTGRHAYPARSIAELRDLWRSQPMPLARLAPDVPAALVTLVAELLALDRNVRPEHAAEVISRLCAIAALPSAEHDTVSHAYLKLPALIARDAALLTIRKRMLALARGDGGALYIEGVAGSGRSRMLDATAIEAKLAGAVVVRAYARNSGSGDFELARALYNQLCRLMPEQAEKAMRLLRTVDALSEPPPAVSRPSIPAVLTSRENVLLREMRDFTLALCRSQRIVLTVDDADRIDERSAALLASLSAKADRNPLLIVFAVDRDARASRTPALRMLCGSASPLEIDELTAAQTEHLMRSVFGDVANLALVAARIHALSRGNPWAAMTFAQHLVDTGLARYEAGRWSLSADIAETALPATLSASLSLQLGTLGREARELAEALAVADGEGASLLDYVALTSHGDEPRTFAALDELIAARVLMADAERYSFSRRGYVTVLRDELSEEQARSIHARVADWLATNAGDVSRRAYHLFLGGREREAIELLLLRDPRAPLPPLPLLERMVERALEYGLETRTILRLRTSIVMKASHSLAHASFWRHAPALLAQVELDCGLARYRELSEVPEHARLARALDDTKRRYDQTEPHARGYTLIEAFQELARVYGAFCALGMGEIDLEAIERLPALDPLIPLAPAIGLIAQRVVIAKAWVRGEWEHVISLQEQLLARFAQPDRGGLDETRSSEVRLGLNYSLGAIEAVLGSARAEKRAQLLETQPQTRVIAWMLRHVLALNQGNVQEARRCLRRAELYRLQLDLEGPPPRLGAGSQLLAHARLGNLLGVKSAVDDLEVLAEEHPGWQPVLLLGRSHLRKLQGDLQGALEPLEQAIALVQANGNLYFSRMAAAHVELLSALGRDDEAAERARYYLKRFDPEEIGNHDTDLYAAAALALARTGDARRGVTLLENAIVHSHTLDRSGISLGLLYHARARLAIAAADAAEFERFADLCAHEFRRTKNPAMAAKFERLLQDAVQAHVAPEVQPAHVHELLDLARPPSLYVTLQSRIDECLDGGDRTRCALTLLLEHVQGFTGCLYGVFENEVKLLAALPEEPNDPGLEAWITALVTAERDADAPDAKTTSAPRGYTDEQGRAFEAMLLLGMKDRNELLAAVFVHAVTPETRVPDRMLLSTLAEALLVRGDVSGAKLAAIITV